MNFIFASQKYENKFGFQDSTFPLQSFCFKKNKKDFHFNQGYASNFWVLSKLLGFCVNLFQDKTQY
jgi:hypothetical protein